MSLLSSSVSITRYRVEGRLREPIMETVYQGLRENAVPEIEDEVSEKTTGWTSFRRPFRPSFEGSSFVVGSYFVFSLRIDKKTIPPRVIDKYVAVEADKRLTESGRQYLSRGEKKMIKEHVINVLSLRIPSTPSLYDVVWRYEDKVMWFFSNVLSANEALEGLFARSFDLRPIRLFPYTIADLALDLTDSERDGLTRVSPSSFVE